MTFFVGVDLGSTTSKAVLIDQAGQVLGRGLTNTRSNYDVAASVARTEALNDARFSLMESSLTRALGPDGAALAQGLRRAWTVAHSLARLGALGRRTTELAAAAAGEATGAKIEGLFAGMARDAEALFTPLVEDRTRFFRDVVGARYMADLDAAAEGGELAFDEGTNAYDRAIVEVENRDEGLQAEALFERALARLAVAPQPSRTLREAWSALDQKGLGEARVVGTGYGRQRLPFPKSQIRSEILCHGLGAHAFFPNTRTVLDIGGQDTKAIQLDGEGLVTGFQMNDRCAAGCGRYLGYIADEMNLGLHELGPLAMSATRPVKISSTCTVFAGVELRELLNLGERRENILLGLHRAIILRAMSLLARSGGIRDEFTFTGGVAKNVAIVQELARLTEQHYGKRVLNIHPDSIYTGALGAALFSKQGDAVAEAA